MIDDVCIDAIREGDISVLYRLRALGFQLESLGLWGFSSMDGVIGWLELE